MATYNDLKQQIIDNGYEVTLEEQLTLQDEYFEQYVLTGMRSEGEAGTREKFYIYKDLETDECYWKDINPFLQREVTFKDKVESYLASKKSDGTIEAGFVDKINTTQRTALVSAKWLDSNGDFVSGEFLLDEDPDGNIQHRQV